METIIHPPSDAAALKARTDLARALMMHVGYEVTEPLSADEIGMQTRRFNDATCILLASTMGTQYEKQMLHLAYGGTTSDLISQYVHLLPEHSPHGQWTLNEYFRQLGAFRDWGSDLITYNCDNVHRLIDAAIDYRLSTGAVLLPCATEHEQRLINFCQEHPRLRNALLDRMPLSGEIDQEMLDLLVALPASSLAEGIL